MDKLAINAIAALGGTTAVAGLIDAPPTTVQSWKSNGIPRSRLSHLKMVAEREGKAIDWSTGLLIAGDGGSADHADGNSGEEAAPSPDKAGNRIGGEATQVAA